MTKAFINADLLSKMPPIPRFFPINFFIKKSCLYAHNRFGKLSLAHLLVKKNRHDIALKSYLVRHFFKIKIYIFVRTLKQELRVDTNTQYTSCYIITL